MKKLKRIKRKYYDFNKIKKYIDNPIHIIIKDKAENERLRTALNGSDEKRKKSIEYIKSNYIDNPIEFKKDLLNILNGVDEQ